MARERGTPFACRQSNARCRTNSSRGRRRTTSIIRAVAIVAVLSVAIVGRTSCAFTMVPERRSVQFPAARTAAGACTDAISCARVSTNNGVFRQLQRKAAFVSPSSLHQLSLKMDDDDDEEMEEEDVDLDDDEDDEDDEGVDYDDDDDDDDDDFDEEKFDEEDLVVNLEDGFDEEDEEEDDEEDFYDDAEEIEQPEAVVYELQDDPDDPNYQAQKKRIEDSIAARKALAEKENFDPIKYIAEEMTDEQAEEMDNDPIIQQVEAIAKDTFLTEDDVKDLDITDEFLENEVSSILDDPFPMLDEGETEDVLPEGRAPTEADFMELDKQWKEMKRLQELGEMNLAPRFHTFDWVSEFEALSNETQREFVDVRKEMQSSAGEEPLFKYLTYDYEFNVTNLMLASVKVNKEMPLFPVQWLAQIQTLSKYQDAQDKGLDFSMEEARHADVDELERYWKGFGYDEIPQHSPNQQSGVIGMDEADEEEIAMSAYENWIAEVYNEETEFRFFDNDDFKKHENVFDPTYYKFSKPEGYDENVDTLFENWEKTAEEEGYDEETRDMFMKKIEYTSEENSQDEEFRGHLVVACTQSEEDLEIAEKITERMEREHGRKVFVETRVYAHARPEDNFFEIWLESYEIDLLHSKRRATYSSQQWDGPAECDDTQIEYVAEQVAFLTSEASRYSYRFEH